MLVAHHLYSASEAESLALVQQNGILIHKDLHLLFHSKSNYNYTKNTVDQFIDFIQRIQNNEIVMPISIQAESEGSEGSETRVYNPERIMKLQERLNDIKDILYVILGKN